MNNRIIDVLPPYEGEVLYSWVIRMLKFCGDGKLTRRSSDILKNLFGSNTTAFPGFYYQKGLEHFVKHCEQLEQGCCFSSVKNMIEQMTVFPFYFSFLNKDLINNFYEKITNLTYYKELENLIRIRVSSKLLEQGLYMKFCPKCIEEQKRICLQREHQIQGNTICWKHGCTLYKIPYRYNWKDLDFIHVIGSKASFLSESFEESEKKVAYSVSLMVHEIMENGFKEDVSELKHKLRSCLYEKKYTTSIGTFFDLKRFCEELNVHYLYTYPALKRDVQLAVCDTEKFYPNPIIYIILINFLFEDLDSYYHYKAGKRIIIPLSYSKVLNNRADEKIKDIDYYVKKLNDNFFMDYAILGDTKNEVIIKHFACGEWYRVSKKHMDIKRFYCRYCGKKSSNIMDNRNVVKQIYYTRFCSTKEYAEKVGKKEITIRRQCRLNNIKGIIKIRTDYLIPEDAPYPVDKRYKKNNVV